MENKEDINNLFLSKLIEKSLFTNRQIQIIYNFKKKEKRPKEITSVGGLRIAETTFSRRFGDFSLSDLPFPLSGIGTMLIRSLPNRSPVSIDSTSRAPVSFPIVRRSWITWTRAPRRPTFLSVSARTISPFSQTRR